MQEQTQETILETQPDVELLNQPTHTDIVLIEHIDDESEQ